MILRTDAFNSIEVYISFRLRDNWTNENHINFANFIFASVTEKKSIFLIAELGMGVARKRQENPSVLTATSF